MAVAELWTLRYGLGALCRSAVILRLEFGAGFSQMLRDRVWLQYNASRL